MRGALLLSVTLLAFGGVAACSFPDVTYTEGDAGPGPSDGTVGPDAPMADAPTADAPTADAPEDGGGGDDATIDVIEENAVFDVVSDYVFEEAPDANPCDKDNDKHLDKSNPACGADADDCCDTDERAHPGETLFWTTPDNCQSYDFNCDGTSEGTYSVNIQQTCKGLSLTGCQGTGFLSDPGCGGMGAFGNCTTSGLSCSAQNTSTQTQGCR